MGYERQERIQAGERGGEGRTVICLTAFRLEQLKEQLRIPSLPLSKGKSNG